MNLSPGLANSCFELLAIVGRRPVALSQLRSSFAMIGVVQSHAVIECCVRMRWLETGEDGWARLSVSGVRLMQFAAHESRLRQAILDLIEIEEPFWIQNAPFGRRRVLDFINVGLAQVFLEAGLVDGVDMNVVAFWDSLAARARGQRNSRLLEIGRRGERLTIAYEERRTGKQPRWVSIDSNADGYDVLSVVARHDARKMTIEVKATQVGMNAAFHLTRNEWNTALEARSHSFHLWDMSGDPARLAVLSPDDIRAHVPSDNGSGEWENVTVPFHAFERKMEFQAVSECA